MSIRELIQSSKKTFSFELFPPKTPEGEKSLYENIERLRRLNPSFISVTMGAMGTNKGNTLEIVDRIERHFRIPGVAHLTCVNATRDNILEIIADLRKRKIENLLCLRGDPPQGTTAFVPPPSGFRYANELVEFVREKTGQEFTIGVAGYPEGHVECSDLESDLDHLKKKVDAGAEYILTQLFFDNDDYFRFVERAIKKGIRLRIVPGVMPVTNFSQLEKFAKMCGARISPPLREKFEKVKDDPKATRLLGIEVASAQCEGLLKNGAPGIHFYTLNQSESVQKIFEGLKL